MEELDMADASPASFVDPISQAMMFDPVSTVDGQTYDRATITEWLASHNTSPLTGAQLVRPARRPLA